MPRTQTFTTEITCELDDEYFGDWDSLSPEIQKFWDDTTLQSHCEGQGGMGAWCHRCPWCKSYEVDEE